MQSMVIRFPSSAGLIVGDGVTVNGLKMGRVEQIDIDGNGVLVRASIDNHISLRADAQANIMMLELMGGKKIDVRPGVSPAPLPPNTVVNGMTDMDIPVAVATLGALSGDLTRVLFRADTLLGNINHLMGDSVFVASIRHTIVTLDATVVLVHNFVARNQDDLEASLKDIKQIVSDVKVFFQANRGQVEKLIKDADKTMSNVDATLAHADSAIASATSMLNEIKQGNGAVHKLIYDKELAIQLDSTVAVAHRLFDQILEHGVNINVRLGTRP
jgi:phospholipid/cholesterol/gamma-HCH transport system substrate-binding protein